MPDTPTTAEAPEASEASDLGGVAFVQLPIPSAVLVRASETATWQIALVSDSFREAVGGTGDLTGMPIATVIPELAHLGHLLVDGSRIRRAEATCALASGERTAVLIDAVPVAGRNDAAIVQMEPRTHPARRRGSRSGERHLQEIANNVNALIYLKRTDGSYTFVNRYYESIIDTDSAQIRGKTDFDLWPEIIATSYRAADEQVMASGTPMEFEEPIARDGVWGMWLSLKFPLYDDDGGLYGVGGISTDISERNAAEAAIRQARDEAERANQAKSEFLSRMSHELRTPLNSILGFGQLLQFERLPGPAASQIDSVVSSGQHLLTLINEVLDIARIESGASEIATESLFVCEPLRAAYEMIKPLAATQDIELALDLHGILYELVEADPQRLKQVFLNVLMNAVKYNCPGGVVTITGQVLGDRLRVLVTDTGYGIAERDLGRIFTPFERLGAEHRTVEGTGLGLTVSKSLMEAMGGSIGVARSVVGRGTEFYIEVPMGDPQPGDQMPMTSTESSPSSARAGADLTGADILYIEDNATNVDVVARILDWSGHPKFRSEATAAGGLRAARTTPPDAILLDVNLPDMHGEEVMSRLRGDPATSQIPVIVLSADATATQRERLLRAGAASYITKPVDVVELLEALRLALSARRSVTGMDPA